MNFKEQYVRENFPWADFHRVSEVTFDIVFDALNLSEWLTKEGSVWYGVCPLHPRGQGNIRVDTQAHFFTCVGCEIPHSGGVRDFVLDYIVFSFDVEADMWLLQFVNGEKEKVLEAFGDGIARTTERARILTEKTYDFTGYCVRLKRCATSNPSKNERGLPFMVTQ